MLQAMVLMAAITYLPVSYNQESGNMNSQFHSKSEPSLVNIPPPLPLSANNIRVAPASTNDAKVADRGMTFS